MAGLVWGIVVVGIVVVVIMSDLTQIVAFCFAKIVFSFCASGPVTPIKN